MSWWYTPQKEDTLYKWDDYEDVVFAIAAICRFKMDEHIVPNYYIYNDNGLVDIIKGSEIDPLSILRNLSWNDEAAISRYTEKLEDSDEEFRRLFSIVGRKYNRTPEQLKEINDDIQYCSSLFEEDLDMDTQYAVKEYGMKYMHGDNLEAYIKNVSYIDESKMASLTDRDLRNIPIILDKTYDMAALPEECCTVFAYNGDTLIGFSVLSHGTASDCDMDAKVIFRFLLLVGATDFVLVHNHPQGKPQMSQADYNITKSLMRASEFMNINMIEHIIIGKNDYDEILMQIKEMDNYDCTDVGEYYREYYIEEEE